MFVTFSSSEETDEENKGAKSTMNDDVLSNAENASLFKKKTYNVVTLGSTGVGKSALLNMIAGRDVFTVGDRATSETQASSSNTCKFNGMFELRLFDTRGTSDSDGADMVDHIRQFDTIDLFILCFDGMNPRFTSYIQNTISHFRQIFPDFLYHTVLVFNKWTQPDEEKRDALVKEYQEMFKRKYLVDKMSCFFIDSFANKEMLRYNEDGSKTVRALHDNIKNATKTQVNELIGYLLLKCNVCNVSGIQAQDTDERNPEALRREMEMLRTDNERIRREKEENERALKEELNKTIELIKVANLHERDIEIEQLRRENEENERRLKEEFNKTIEQMNRERAANMERVKAEMESNKNWWWRLMAVFGWK